MNRRKSRLALAMAHAIPLSIVASHTLAQDVDLANFSNGFRIDGANAYGSSGFLSLIHI